MAAAARPAAARREEEDLEADARPATAEDEPAEDEPAAEAAAAADRSEVNNEKEEKVAPSKKDPIVKAAEAAVEGLIAVIHVTDATVEAANTNNVLLKQVKLMKKLIDATSTYVKDKEEKKVEQK
jgi:hypothetical protein